MVWVALVLLLLLVPTASAQTSPTYIAGTGQVKAGGETATDTAKLRVTRPG